MSRRVPPRQDTPAGHGYQVRGRWLVQVPEPGRPARLGAVEDAWTASGYQVWVDAEAVDATDSTGVQMRIDVTTPDGILLVTVTTPGYAGLAPQRGAMPVPPSPPGSGRPPPKPAGRPSVWAATGSRGRRIR